MAGVDTTPIITVRRNMGQAAVNRMGCLGRVASACVQLFTRIVNVVAACDSPATYAGRIRRKDHSP